MKAWLARGTGNKVCPVCRSVRASAFLCQRTHMFSSMALVVEQLQRFTTGAKPPAPVAGPAPFQHTSEGEVAPKSSRKVEYNFLPDDLRESIDHLECTGSYGSKIEAIVRHLLQIQLVEPGAKSISERICVV
jgi:E3 ubiquitin-protein ligase SHPRH